MIYLVPEKLKRRKGKQITDLDFFFVFVLQFQGFVFFPSSIWTPNTRQSLEIIRWVVNAGFSAFVFLRSYILRSQAGLFLLVTYRFCRTQNNTAIKHWISHTYSEEPKSCGDASHCLFVTTPPPPQHHV